MQYVLFYGPIRAMFFPLFIMGKKHPILSPGLVFFFFLAWEVLLYLLAYSVGNSPIAKTEF